MRPAVLNGIHGLRAASCLLIAYFHLTENLAASTFNIWFPFQQTPGIHIFMVISGFMLAYTAQPSDNPLRFILRRLVRIVPLYWLLTLVAIAFAAWHSWLLPGADISPVSILQSLFFFPRRDHLGLIEPILFVGWTLNYIVISYAVFALAMFGPARLRPFIAILLLLCTMLLANLLPRGDLRSFWTDWIQLDLVAGLFAGAMLRHPRVIDWVRTNTMWPMIIAGGVILVSASLSDLAGLPRIIVCGVAAALVVFALAGQDIYRSPMTDGPLSWLGRRSYGVYLLHPLFIPLVGTVVLGSIGHNGLAVFVIIGAVFTLTIAGAALCYRFVELPANTWARRQIAALDLPGARRLSPNG